MRASYPKYFKSVPSIFGVSVYEIIIIGFVINFMLAFGISVSFSLIMIFISFIIYKSFKNRIDFNSLYLQRYKLNEIDLSKLIALKKKVKL